MNDKALIILVAGPYRSGTNDDPVLMENNLRKMEEAALLIFRAGHIPVVGEWFALPLLKVAGSKYPGDAIYEGISYPIARRMITRADAIWRIEGASKGADGDVEKAHSLGIPVYYKAEDIPGLS
ncbi:DUF4406 domain-containing protein [Mucilaginibacter flavidus]|uniref:DUF4406 domain-containing protein n=1 Tax=Mucilaginibacter flavidus TaxID=2949309 RepID=UPI0020936FB1|nr:DUF4406 domain-containing protein [Mucilaginibacter flavidus]MCO5947272.1 DUF4406 domain-containing protein [Mucilaginibacter flavidus]